MINSKDYILLIKYIYFLSVMNLTLVFSLHAWYDENTKLARIHFGKENLSS